MYKHILIPTDGSPLSHKAARAAIAFAKKTGARVTAYHALEIIPTYLGGEAALMDPTIIDIIEATARKRAGKDLAKIAAAARAAGVRCATYMSRLRGDRQRGEAEEVRRDLHRLARPRRRRFADPRERDAARARPLQGPGGGLPVAPPRGRRA
jgi:nucleotide-binding universal stress UspA family protein